MFFERAVEKRVNRRFHTEVRVSFTKWELVTSFSVCR